MKKKHEKTKLELIEDLKNTKNIEKIFCCFQYYDKKKKEYTTHSVIIGEILPDMLHWMSDTVVSQMKEANKPSEYKNFIEETYYKSNMFASKVHDVMDKYFVKGDN